MGTSLLGGIGTTLCEVFITSVFHIPGGFSWMFAIDIVGGILCLRLPLKVESSPENVQVIYTTHSRDIKRAIFVVEGSSEDELAELEAQQEEPVIPKDRVINFNVMTALSGVSTLKIFIGFIFLFMIFYSRSPNLSHISTIHKILITAASTGAAGVGGFIGNILGTKFHAHQPHKIVLSFSILGCVTVCLSALAVQQYDFLLCIVITALICAISANAAKVSLDATIQKNIQHYCQASIFGISESVIQLAWVLGAALGALLPTRPALSLSVLAVVLIIGLAHTIMTYYHTGIMANHITRRLAAQR